MDRIKYLFRGIKIGSKVKLNEEGKEGLIDNDCQEYLDKFGDCEGIVIDIKNHSNSEYVLFIAKVEWEPSNIKQKYNILDLDLIK